jgi:DNA-binding MarR family transcriptional regulator
MTKGPTIHTVPLPALLGEAKEMAIAELHRRLAAEGHSDIRPGHGCVFRFIEPEGSRLTDLAERSGLTKQAVGEVADDLARLGYVERVPDASDRRVKIIRMTERGRDGRRAAERIFADIERRWAREFGKERLAVLRETLEIITAAERGASLAA